MAEITFDQLEQNNACDNKLTFRDLFGEKSKVTVELARKYANEFDWAWAADNLLPDGQRKKWTRLTQAYRDRFSAELKIADYTLKHTPTGLRRVKITDRQRKIHRDRVDALRREVRMMEAETFALLFIGTGRIKKPKTEKLLDEFRNKVDNLVRDIMVSNESEKVFEDSYGLNSRLEQLLQGSAYNVSSLYRSVRAELREKHRQAVREAEAANTSQGDQMVAAREASDRYFETRFIDGDSF